MSRLRVYFRYFKVRGSGRFPIAMLALDHCWPASTLAAATIEQSIWAQSSARVTVTLRQYVFGRHDELLREVWLSAGWPVVEVKPVEESGGRRMRPTTHILRSDD